jgi:hypothetical protein
MDGVMRGEQGSERSARQRDTTRTEGHDQTADSQFRADSSREQPAPTRDTTGARSAHTRPGGTDPADARARARMSGARMRAARMRSRPRGGATAQYPAHECGQRRQQLGQPA